MKPYRIRPLADREIDKAARYYARESRAAAYGLYDAVSSALETLSTHPDVGSPRYAPLFPGDSLRSWPLGKYPYILFYLERPDHLDVIRFLHGHRDIPAVLRAADDKT